MHNIITTVTFVFMSLFVSNSVLAYETRKVIEFNDNYSTVYELYDYGDGSCSINYEYRSETNSEYDLIMTLGFILKRRSSYSNEESQTPYIIFEFKSYATYLKTFIGDYITFWDTRETSTRFNYVDAEVVGDIAYMNHEEIKDLTGLFMRNRDKQFQIVSYNTEDESQMYEYLIYIPENIYKIFGSLYSCVDLFSRHKI